MTNDASEWTLDLAKQQVTHSSGLQLQIEGSLKDPSAITTLKVPAELDGLTLVRLIRQGTEFCRQYRATVSSRSSSSSKSSSPSKTLKKPAQPQGGRKVLSLKRDKH